MRDYLVLGTILLSLPVCLARPFIGCLIWTWIAFMSPHHFAWGFAQTFPVALLVGGATLGGFLLSSEPKWPPRNFGTYGVIALFVCLTISTLLAEYPGPAFEAWDQRSKILLMSLVIIALTNTRERLRLVCLVTAVSIGFFGLKGGVFALRTGLQHKIYGPPGSFLADNTSVALALTMALPMLFYLRREIEWRSVRLLFGVTFVATILGVISSYSRGGFLALVAVVLLLFVKNRRKLLGAIVLGVTLFSAAAFVPKQWTQRMETIEDHDDEGSAQARLNAWRLAWRLALLRPLFGWGPQALEDKGLYDRYYADSPTRADVHSSYFQLLGENGFVTFGVWVSLFAWCLASLQRLSWRFRASPEHGWITTYADMSFISLVAFAISGAFLEMAFFDLIYHVVGFTIVLNGMAAQLHKAAVADQRLRPGRLRLQTNGARPARLTLEGTEA